MQHPWDNSTIFYQQVPYVRYTKQLHGEQMVNIIESIIKANND